MLDSMNAFIDSLFRGDSAMSSLQGFMLQGGPVLWCLLAVVALFWLFVIERWLFLFVSYPKLRTGWLNAWNERHEHISWYAHAIREGWLSEARISLFHNLNIIKVLVSLCPMLGLLGTVTGMISVFDTMSYQGNDDVELMASGIALATLPTMAGMVAALVGIFVHARLVKACQLRSFNLERSLRSEA